MGNSDLFIFQHSLLVAPSHAEQSILLRTGDNKFMNEILRNIFGYRVFALLINNSSIFIHIISQGCLLPVGHIIYLRNSSMNK